MGWSRRQTLLLLSAGPAMAADTATKLARILDPKSGLVVLLDINSGRLLASNDATAAGRTAATPGSTVKPFVFFSLLQRKRLGAETRFLCPRNLRLDGRIFDCVHPVIAGPMTIETALAYSCNCFVAKMAERFQAGELAQDLGSFGFSASGSSKALALGEEGIRATPLDLANAYRQLVLRTKEPGMAVIREGLRSAVEYGTARAATIKDVAIAGKTGSGGTGSLRTAWFAGYSPVKAPGVVIAVMVRGRSGGSDAAPLASEILSAHYKSEL